MSRALISGFRRHVDETCALLGYYASSCGNCLPTFRDNLSIPYLLVKSPSRKVGPIRCPETSVNHYRTTPRNIPEERRSNVHMHAGEEECIVSFSWENRRENFR
jgi:hypothetical protein